MPKSGPTPQTAAGRLDQKFRALCRSSAFARRADPIGARFQTPSGKYASTLKNSKHQMQRAQLSISTSQVTCHAPPSTELDGGEGRERRIVLLAPDTYGEIGTTT